MNSQENFYKNNEKTFENERSQNKIKNMQKMQHNFSVISTQLN